MSTSIVTWATSYNMHILLWLQEVGILEQGCDLQLFPTADDELERIRLSGRFGRVFTSSSIVDGNTLFSFINKITETIENQDRHYRHKLEYLKYYRPEYFFRDATFRYDRWYYMNPQMVDPMSLWIYDEIRRGVHVHAAVWEHGYTSYVCPFYANFLRLNAFGLLMEMSGIPHSCQAVEALYVFQPELTDFPKKSSSMTVKVPVIDKNNTNYKLVVNKIYGSDEESLNIFLSHDFIMFDNLVPGYEEELPALREIVGHISKIIGKDRLLVKFHPGYLKNPYSDLDIVGVSSSHPWELYCLNLPSLENKVLITGMSNSVIVPKISFDEEPYIIHLGQLLSWNNETFMKFFDKVKATYRSPGKIFIPNNITELQVALRSVCRAIS